MKVQREFKWIVQMAERKNRKGRACRYANGDKKKGSYRKRRRGWE